jgi:hypothetical protein
MLSDGFAKLQFDVRVTPDRRKLIRLPQTKKRGVRKYGNMLRRWLVKRRENDRIGMRVFQILVKSD